MNDDERYQSAAGTFGAALERLARAYEMDPEKRRDLLQEIHFELWRSFKGYEERCSLRTWVYRIAHHTAISHIVRERRSNLSRLVGLEEIEAALDPSDHGRQSEDRIALGKLYQLIHELRPLDRQIMLLYLEDMDSESIGEITGISAGAIRTQIHRIKNILARRFHSRGAI
jgi:RNA polymerase sigma-70 factor (ECF subfamily)